jgi:hypothetical protein
MDNKTIVTAEFIGDNGSRGFKSGVKYALELLHNDNGSIYAKNIYGDQTNLYSTESSFTANWRVLDPAIAADRESMLDENIGKEPAQAQVTVRDTQATSFLDPNLYIQMKQLANDLIKSKAIPSSWQTAEQVFVGLQAGLEMGMKPMEAMNSLYVVNGAINVWGKATTNRLRQHGYTVSYKDETDESCTAVVSKYNPQREEDDVYQETMTFGEAVDSGYTTRANPKIGWKPGINRRKKLRYGALSLIIANYIPEVLGSAAGIAEVSQDYIEAEVVDDAPAKDRKAAIRAAEAKRQELTAGNFTPKPVENKEA